MLKKIRSQIILKKLFSLLDYKVKLIMIIYNKNIQKKLGLNLIDYKRCSGKYKKENNGEIKIYSSYTNNLIFEGKYLNGKRNGKGKEYNLNEKLIFEGEYLNGKKWKGKEKIYDYDRGVLIYEYELSNGIKEGEYKKYDKYAEKLIFSGQYINGEIKEGTEYDHNGWTVYKGQYLNGKRNGKGKLYYEKFHKIKYEGDFLNGFKQWY